MKNSIEYSLSQLCTLITKGTTPSTLGHSFTSTGINFVKAESISRTGELVPSTFAFISNKTHAALKRSQIEANDLLLTIAGIYLGKVSIIREKHTPANTNQAVAIIRVDKHLAVPEFIRYYLFENSMTKYMNMLCPQSAQPNLNLTQLRGLKIQLPPLPTQRKIAAILTAYEDLIETNKRRIALLEKMAEELYREWFVRMRFPGHKTTKFVKGVPEGWKMTKIGNAFGFTGGGTPSKDVANYWNEGTVNWFTPSDITGGDGIFFAESGEKCSEEGLARSSAKMFPAYSVMMTSRATIGAIGINATPACTNQGFITCIPNQRFPLPYLYQWLKLAKPSFEQLCGGATFPELTKGTFKKLEILTPPESLVKSFEELSRPILKSIEHALEGNRMLTKTRDLLLPRLISGKLSVEDLDIQFPPSMANEHNR